MPERQHWHPVAAAEAIGGQPFAARLLGPRDYGAFAALMAQTPRQRWLARLTRPLRWLTGPMYNMVARLTPER